MLIVHLLLGSRRLRGLDYYRDDPFIPHLLGLRRLPDVSTLSRGLKNIGAKGVEKFRKLNNDIVLERLEKERFARIAIEFVELKDLIEERQRWKNIDTK